MIGDMDTFLRGEKKGITNREDLKYQLNKTEKYQNTIFLLFIRKLKLQKTMKHNTESTGQPNNFPICKESFTEKTDFKIIKISPTSLPLFCDQSVLCNEGNNTVIAFSLSVCF